MMNVILGVLVSLLTKLVTNPEFIENLFFMLAKKIADKTPSDFDNKLIALAEAALKHQESKQTEEPQG